MVNSALVYIGERDIKGYCFATIAVGEDMNFYVLIWKHLEYVLLSDSWMWEKEIYMSNTYYHICVECF